MRQGRDDKRRVTFTPASAIEPEVVRWLWEGRVPLGALTIIAGQPGLGKSTTTVHLGARLSRGALEGSLYGKPAHVLYVTLEDHRASVVRPRLEAAGADLTRIELVGVQVDERDELVTLPGDLAEIEEGAVRLGARMLVIDPIVATLDGTVDSHRDQSVRRALAPLSQFAERADLAVIGVMHLSKQQGTDLLNRVSGSVAFGGAPRSVFVFARDPEDPDGEQGERRVLVHAKANWGRYASSLRCRIDTASVDTRSGPSEQPVLAIVGECDTTGADLTSTRQPGRREEAIEFLKELLGDGERRESEEIRKAAEARGLAWRTVQRAKPTLGVEHESEGFPAVTYWRLPVAPTPVTPPVAQLDRRDRENGFTEPATADPGATHANSVAYGAAEPTEHETILATPEEEALLERLTTAAEPDGALI
jgi:AAA domain